MKRVDVVYVVLNDDHENVLMVKNRGKNGSYFTLPGGAVEQGETLAEAAEREVKEETGYEVKVGNILCVTEAFFDEPNHHAVFFTFSGEIKGGDIDLSNPEEIESVEWQSLKEAEKHALVVKQEGLLKEMKTVPYLLRR
ncbi:NUDIX hydrolase [Jeotgalibacillus sp. R-1-5s-1]|uniref:NUDIX hydrolase n=1 Tax=Jeotgalibacillus sp. R-1-5s-1 TaxID=2555897 RepID=UPI00106C5E34|nr:NUDIX hydrolase [Jeotgalibacillus sp. R-1-5s-1]TFD94521.1 NUDIX hydrolase [Jeotgalibacillus sp. R-1-5s-1]